VGEAEGLDLYRDLCDRNLRREGLLVAEGRWLVERLLASGWPIVSVVCAPRFEEYFQHLVAGHCPVLVASEVELAAVAGFRFHRGVLAAGRRPEPCSLEFFLQALPAGAGSATLVVCPQLTGEYNLGSIVRTAAAFGAEGLATGSRCCDPLSRRALKVSMGASFRLPLLALGEEERAAGLLHEAGFSIVGASAAPSARPLASFRRPARVAVVLGEEAEGLGNPWEARCEELLTIPMPGATDSLNVAVAAGIFLYALQDGIMGAPRS
jgi:tRNA G18 (ribose-2'-O)-methylase SpoU